MVSTPLKNMKVSWDYYFQYMESLKIHVPNYQPDTHTHIYIYHISPSPFKLVGDIPRKLDMPWPGALLVILHGLHSTTNKDHRVLEAVPSTKFWEGNRSKMEV